MNNPSEARARLRQAHRVAVLTGAGISAESGIPTFREAQTGLWARFSPEELASPQAYVRDATLVWDWYAWRYRLCAQAEPNAAHLALAALESQSPHVLLATQNVDGLHRRAGSMHLVELHGNITQARCEGCGVRFALPAPDAFRPPPTCAACGSRMRPDVVWFGESLPQLALKRARQAFTACDVALVIGTSSVVEPAASLGRMAKTHGAYLIEINPEETPLSRFADFKLQTAAVAGLALLL